MCATHHQPVHEMCGSVHTEKLMGDFGVRVEFEIYWPLKDPFSFANVVFQRGIQGICSYFAFAGRQEWVAAGALMLCFGSGWQGAVLACSFHVPRGSTTLKHDPFRGRPDSRFFLQRPQFFLKTGTR